MNTSTQELINKVIKAHGGESASKFQNVKIHINIGGLVWGMKGYENPLQNVIFEGSLTEQKSSWKNIFKEGYKSTFEPNKVELFDENENLIEELILSLIHI